MAQTLNGFGPNIYSRLCSEWKDILGKDDGLGVYNLVFATRRANGAVPRNTSFAHWK